MIRYVLVLIMLSGAVKAQIPDLIFSEYIEGSGSEKYLEIYNGTGSTVTLTGAYSISLYANGTTTATSTLNLTGSLANGQVLVLKNSAAVAYTGTATTTAVCNFNGDDAIALINGGTVIDVIGLVGCDPGTAWLANSMRTEDRTLVRKPDVCAGYNGTAGSCTPTASASFPTLSTEWICKSINDFSNLGTHYSACGNACAGHRFFRSKQNGAWYDVNTWESAGLAAGPYSSACIYPTYNNADSVVIKAGDTVSLVKAVLPADQLLVSGCLTLGDSADLDLYAGAAGADLIVAGTLIDSTRSTGSFGVFAASGATWQLGASGNFIKLKTSSSTVFRDNYEGGIATIPATATWYLRNIDAANLPAFTSANMYYPNLVIENYSGTLWDMSTSALGSFNGATTIIKGNFDVGGAGTTAVTVAQNSATATATSNPLEVQGNVTVRNGSRFINRKTGSPDLYGGGLNVKGDITVNGTLEIVNTVTDAVQSVLRLSGTAPQNISGSTAVTVSGFDLNKPGPSLNAATSIDIQVTDSLYLNSGILQTTGGSEVVLYDTTVISSPASLYTNLPANTGWESSYINGAVTISDNGGAAVTGPFPIPVGKDIFRPVLLKNFSCNGTFTIEYFKASPRTTFNNTMGSGLDHISDIEYWTIDAPAGSPVADIELSFYDPNSGGVTNLADLRVARFNGSQWVNEGNTATSGTPGTNGSVTSNPVTTFSPFTLASISANNPLPLRSIVLSAARRNSQARLLWQVNADADVVDYAVEYSANGRQFVNVTKVNGGRHQSAAEYAATAGTTGGRNYYRVAARLQNGRIVYSNIVLLSETGGNLLVYPNPVNNLLMISGPATNAQYELRSGSGTRVMGGRLTGNTAVIDVRQLPAGMYYLRVMGEDGQVQVKAVVKE